MVALRDCNLGMAMLDWDDLRFFLAVARHRTLAVAAKHLHVTQSTVSRRLASLQEGMGVRLLQRTADGYLLTLAGESIRALSVERAVAGQDVRLDGLVRVAGAQMLTSHLLAPSYAALHGLHPGILIEALPSLPGEPLATQDADIAVRLRRSTASVSAAASALSAKAIRARSVPRLTDASTTPGTPLRAFSTRRTQDAHVIPSIPMSISAAGFGAVVFGAVRPSAVITSIASLLIVAAQPGGDYQRGKVKRRLPAGRTYPWRACPGR